jgi:hypothetical protein
MRKAKEKMARRQGKREKLAEHDEPLTSDHPSDPSGDISGS